MHKSHYKCKLNEKGSVIKQKKKKTHKNSKKNPQYLRRRKTMRKFALAKAQMAESVDALVSNTSGAIHPGSIPGLGTEKRLRFLNLGLFHFLSKPRFFETCIRQVEEKYYICENVIPV